MSLFLRAGQIFGAAHSPLRTQVITMTTTKQLVLLLNSFMNIVLLRPGGQKFVHADLGKIFFPFFFSPLLLFLVFFSFYGGEVLIASPPTSSCGINKQCSEKNGRALGECP